MKPLNEDGRKALLLSGLGTLALLFLFFIRGEYFTLISAVPVVVLAVVFWIFLRKRSIPSYNKNQVLLIVAVISVLYLTLYYLSGLYFGFFSVPSGVLTLGSLYKYVLPVSVVIVATEIMREVLLAQPIKASMPIAYALGVISELICWGGIPEIHSSYHLADFFGMTVFPALTANLLFNYLTKRYGKMPSIIYRLIMTLYIYFIPIAPNIPEVLSSFILLLLPLLIYAFVDMLFEKKVRRAREKRGKGSIVVTCVAFLLMLSFVLLISCQFRFGVLVIASKSMQGEINKGDAVIYEAYEEYGEIKENDVIVFEENNSLVVHRVVKIDTVNGQRQYITKGDANENNDAGYRTDASIVGVVRLKVLYIGYPSVWLQELINKQRGGVNSV